MWQFDHLVIAFPIHEAIRCFDDVPADVVEAVDGLRYNSLRVAFVAVNNESLMDKSAIYIPDPDVLPHRVCYMGYFSPNMVRPGTSSLVAETTVRSGDATDRLSDEDFLDVVIGDLDRVGHPAPARRHPARDAALRVCIPGLRPCRHSRNTRIIRAHFAERGIDLLGRFAEFEYITATRSCAGRSSWPNGSTN